VDRPRSWFFARVVHRVGVGLAGDEHAKAGASLAVRPATYSDHSSRVRLPVTQLRGVLRAMSSILSLGPPTNPVQFRAFGSSVGGAD